MFLFNASAVNSQSPILNKESQNDIDTTLEKTTLMVKSLSLNGWKLHDDIEIFKPINLYDKIDGRAEYYLSYDLVWAIFCSFRSSTDDRFPIELSIFNMLTPINAFGAFSGERMIGASQLKFGRDSYCSGTNYYIWKGQFYIQITASDTIDELNKACLELAEKLTKNLYDSGQPVWGFEILPANNLISQSVQYFLIDALGHIFLKDTFTAKYYKDNIEIPVFLSHQNSSESVETVFSKFKDFANKYGKGAEFFSKDGIDILVCDMDKYYDIIFRKGLYVAGVTELRDKNLAIKEAIDFWKQLHVE
jgi:hypothetical protein